MKNRQTVEASIVNDLKRAGTTIEKSVKETLAGQERDAESIKAAAKKEFGPKFGEETVIRLLDFVLQEKRPRDEEEEQEEETPKKKKREKKKYALADLHKSATDAMNKIKIPLQHTIEVQRLISGAAPSNKTLALLSRHAEDKPKLTLLAVWSAVFLQRKSGLTKSKQVAKHLGMTTKKWNRYQTAYNLLAENSLLRYADLTMHQLVELSSAIKADTDHNWNAQDIDDQITLEGVHMVHPALFIGRQK